jgi:biopolymer transport protein ExbD
MSAGIETGGGGRGSQSQDFELNLASIIDAFTVLIAFMLASASFLSIGILDAGVAAAGATAAAGTPPSINVTIELAPDSRMVVKTTGKSQASTPITAKSGTWDYDSLTSALGQLKTKYPDVNAVTLVADNVVQYKDVVKAMEVTRKTLPVVLLGGF